MTDQERGFEEQFEKLSPEWQEFVVRIMQLMVDKQKGVQTDGRTQEEC